MSLTRCALSFVLLVTLTGAVPLANNADVVENNNLPAASIDYRLHGNVKPLHYAIELEPNIIPGDFTGASNITINVYDKPTDTITLHAKDLEIYDAYTNLLHENKTFKSPAIKSSFQNETDFLILKLTPKIPVGNYTLQLKYKGLLHDDLNGFYRSSYINSQGREVWLATTQFEPTWARRAFPCFDEPAMKATFEISIKHFKNYTAISNTRRASIDTTNCAPKWCTKFAITPPMSTYLVAFVISDFRSLSNDDQNFTVYSRENAIQTGEYALNIGMKELKELHDYIGIDQPIKKMDNVAIPQFRAGAMENWGIVTYRESALLFEENVTTTESKEGIATVISHEFTHQWFGNLVGPLWWDYAWLNEGFANYFQYFITDKVEKTWRLMDQFVIKNLQATAFAADDNETQHPMDATVNSPDEISKIFDSITYSKAGSVIRMFSHVLGESVFQSRLKTYLETNKNSAASSIDLFKALAPTSDPIAETLNKSLTTWVTQPGYPVVTVIRDHKTGAATLTQKRFLTKKSKEPKEFWFIPINWATQDKINFSDTKPMQWISNVKKTTPLPPFKTNNWVILNNQQTGYYRVNYDAQNWKLIADYLKNPNNTNNIHVLNRAQLLDDSFHLAHAGELSNYTAFLEITEYLQHEDDYIPWHAAYRAFSVLNKALTNTEKYRLFQLYILRLTEKLEKTVGYNETVKDDHIMKFNRLNAIRLACTMGSPKCLAATHDVLVKHVGGSKKASADLRTVVLCAGIRTANATVWEQTYNFTVKMAKDSNERSILVDALGCSSDVKILEQYLNKTLSVESMVNRTDVIKAVYSGSAAGIDVAFDFISLNLKTITDLDGDTRAVLGYLNQIGSMMTTGTQLEKLDQFIKSLPENNKDFAEALKANALVSANNNNEWVKKYEPQFLSFLDSQKLDDKDEPVTEKSNSSNISLSSILLTAFMTLVAVFITRIQ